MSWPFREVRVQLFQDQLQQALLRQKCLAGGCLEVARGQLVRGEPANLVTIKPGRASIINWWNQDDQHQLTTIIKIKARDTAMKSQRMPSAVLPFWIKIWNFDQWLKAFLSLSSARRSISVKSLSLRTWRSWNSAAWHAWRRTLTPDETSCHQKTRFPMVQAVSMKEGDT